MIKKFVIVKNLWIIRKINKKIFARSYLKLNNYLMQY